MYSALPAARCDVATQAGQAGSGTHDSEHPETIETRLWLEEHDWLFTVLRSEGNVSPTFRFPDPISACVSLVFLHDDAPARIFDFLGTQLVLRSPLTPRRRESERSCAGTRCAEPGRACGSHLGVRRSAHAQQG